MSRNLPRTAIFTVLACVMLSACGRHKLDDDEIQRNRIFATLIEREDRRAVENDDFIRINLQNSPYPEARVWSALALGRIGDPRGLPWLYAAFDSPYAAVRAAAAFAVGKIEERDALRTDGRTLDPRTLPELTHLLADPSADVQRRAAEAIGRCGSPADALEIARWLESSHTTGMPEGLNSMDAGITALMRLKNPATFSFLERLASSDDPAVEWRVLNALVRVDDRNARPIFLRRLRSGDPEVRFYAVRGIGICGDSGLSGLLVPYLPPVEAGSGNPVSPAVRVAAVQALGNLRSRQAVPAIESALAAAPIRDDNPDQVNFAIQAAAALGEIGAPEGEAVLASLLKVPGPVADNAVIALAKILKQRPDHFFDVARGISIADPHSRRAWARALGELGGERAILGLKEALIRATDEHAAPADLLAVPAVLSALASAGAPDLQRILQPYLVSHDGVVVRAALAAYNPPSGTRAPWTPVLEAYAGFASGSDVETKVALIDRLEPWAREPAVRTALMAILKDRDRNARIAAARLLRGSGGPEFADDPGPAEVHLTREIYEMSAAERKDRVLAILETSRGDIELELYMEDAPLTCANFLRLARQGFYNGLTFMRAVPHFVVQGGDPRNDQEGGPGYTIRCEVNLRPFERGSVGMALAGKDTGGSQFFITLAAQPHLDGSYTCFGRVLSGMLAAEHIVPGDKIIRVRIEEDVTIFDYRRY